MDGYEGMCDLEAGRAFGESSSEAWGELANVVLSMAGMYASHLYHKIELKKAQEMHKEQLKISQEQHNAEISQAFGLHREGVDLERRLHLHQLGIAFEQHFMQLSADLFSASKEAERDMYRQRDSQFQTIMISATVMMGVSTAIIVEGQLPEGSPQWLEIALATCSGLGFAMFVNTIIISIRVLKMLSKFMYLKAYDQSRGIDHMLKHTDRALRKIYNTITRYNDEEERRLSQSFTPADRKTIFEGGEGKSELGPDDSPLAGGGGVARQALGPHGRVVEEILQDQRRFHELLLRQHDNTAVRRDLNRVTCTFEDYWTQECAWYSRVVYITFGVGMAALLAAACLYVYGQYVVLFESRVAAYVFIAMVSLAVMVGAAMLIEVAERKLQLARYPSLQSSPSKHE